MPKIIVSVVLFVCCLVQGCATFEGVLVRQTDAEDFLARMDTQTEAVLARGDTFTLDRCIAVALDGNLTIKTAALEKRLAKLNRRIAFANFLPEVSLEYTSTELDRAPATQLFGNMSTTMQDRIVRETALQAHMPIFAPATWFLYAIHRRGEEISDIAEDYTRQMIALQVTGLYFQCLATEESQRTLKSQRDAATTLLKEVEAWYKEGMITEADLAQVCVLSLAREQALEMNTRARERCQAELLTAMGMAPTASIQLVASSPVEAPQGDLDDWILEALLHHPRLAIEDRLIAIEQEKARIAIANFLPALVGFAGRSHTSNSFMAYPYVSAVGFTGLMTLFNGFANVNEYLVARTEQEKAFLAREQESLALLLETVRAHTHLADAEAQSNLAQAAAAAAALKLKEDKAKMHEGLLRPSEMLDTVAQHDAAQVNATNAQYQKQVMAAIARNVLGVTWQGQKEDNNE